MVMSISVKKGFNYICMDREGLFSFGFLFLIIMYNVSISIFYIINLGILYFVNVNYMYITVYVN